MLTLLCGRSGSGKTSELINRIKADAAATVPTVLIVPEQSVFITEEHLAQALPMAAQKTFSVMSFSKFAVWVFEHCGKLTTVPFSYTAQVTMMWKTLDTLSDSLKVYHQMRKNAGLIRPLLSAMDDFSRFGITPDELQEAAAKLHEKAPLSNKLRDLSLIYATYTELLDAYNKGNQHDEIRRATELLRTADPSLLAGYHFYFDSFAFFTAPEYALLIRIASRAENVTVALCLDPEDYENVIFADAVRTESKLIQTAKDLGLSLNTVALHVPVCQNTALAAIERNLWSRGITIPYNADDDTLRVIECPNPYAEAETAALHVRELIMQGLRYRDIAVIVRDTDNWYGIIDAAFEKYNIPYFLSESLPLSAKMPVQMLLSVLRAIDSKWSTEDMIALVKTGMFNATAEDVSLFAEYVETWKIHGDLFVTGNWTMNPDGFVAKTSPRAQHTLEAANRIRNLLMSPLLKLQTSLKNATNGAAMCRALGTYLKTIGLTEALQNNAAKDWNEGHPRDAFDMLRTGDAILAVLNDAALQMSSTEKPTIAEFCALLTIVFTGSTIGSVPQTSDCVMIGAADVLRTEKVKTTLLLGLNEGEFPKNTAPGGTFSEQDKSDLAQADFNADFCQSGRINAADEYYYLYRAVTRPTEKLWMSYHTYNAEMEKCFPSISISAILRLCQGLKVNRFSPAVLRSSDDSASFETAGEGVTAVIPFPNNTISLTQSKLDRYAQCPYSFYAEFILGLQKKTTGDFGPADMGTFVHYVLEKIVPTFVNLETGEKNIPDDEKLNLTVDAVAQTYIDSLQIPTPFLTDSLTHTLQKMKDVAHIMAAGICRDMKESIFCPTAFEMSVGDGDDAIPLIFSDRDNRYRIVYSGKIDRIDTVTQYDTIYAVVVDYKTGAKKFEAQKIDAGLSLQLPLYLNGLIDSHFRDARPIAAYYLTVDEKGGVLSTQKSGFFNKDHTLPEKFSLGKPAGKSSDEFDEVLQKTKNVFFGIADKIYRGEFPRTPSEDACQYCPIVGNCMKAIKKKS